MSAALEILIADDSEDARNLYKKYFEFHGVGVDTAGDGVEALAAIRRRRPDILVLDLAMPRMTGWEVLRDLRNDESLRSLPVLVLSGQGVRSSALAAGADGYLDKPCLPQVLLDEVLRLVHPSAVDRAAS
jgi:CheY-like chemotaxis protein